MVLQRSVNGAWKSFGGLGPTARSRLCGSGARRPPGDNPSPMASLVSEILAASLPDLMAEARALRRGPLVTYSPKVFVPLTTLCRDVCGYCTFARPPRRGERAYMPSSEVLEIARAGAAAGLHARRSSHSVTSPSCCTASPARAAPRLRFDDRIPRALRTGRARREASFPTSTRA